MSCVVGLVHDGRVWLGGDAAASDSVITVTYTTPKVFRRGRLLFGCVDSFRMRDLLAKQFTPPRFKQGQDVDEYIGTVIEEIRCTFEFGSFNLSALLDEDDEDEEINSGAILMACAGRLFMVDYDYHVGEVRDPYMAIGAGASFALGSLNATQELVDKYSPRLRVTNALRVAAYYCQSVKAPFKVLSGK